MEKLVQRRIDLEKRSPGCKESIRNMRICVEKIRAADRQIDTLVYDLYGLTADEIAFVDEAIGKNNSTIW